MTEIPAWEPEALPMHVPLDIDDPGRSGNRDRDGAGNGDDGERLGSYVIVIDLA